MPRPLRLALAALGLAAAVYGAASLTGGWLGTPPWWERATGTTEVELTELPVEPGSIALDPEGGEQHIVELRERGGTEPVPGREWFSLAFTAAGLALWPRRSARTG